MVVGGSSASPLRGQSFYLPAGLFCVFSIPETVMQTAGTTLPKLELAWNQSIPTPKVRAFKFIYRVLQLQFFGSLRQPLLIGYDL